MYSYPVKQLYKQTGLNMNTQLQNSVNASANHWALWVSPSQDSIAKLKDSDTSTQSKTLLLHPKKPELIMSALLQALESGLYSTVRMAKAQLAQRDQNILQLRALRFGVEVEWTDSAPRLNRASQLSLI
jgi:cell division inhibitor SulA